MAGKKCVAMLLAGGQGSRLGALTKNIAKPAVSFAGKYRIIDFSLSNCVNSSIDTVGVLTQYKPLVLNHYLGTGEPWDLDSADGGVHILPPYATETGGKWYEGTADAIYRNIDFVDTYDPEHVLILSGDHLYKMDYADMLEKHIARDADLTISVYDVPLEEASRFGIMSVNEEDRIFKFSEKPKKPDSTLASMGIYIFKWPELKAELIKDHKVENSEHDFGKNIIPSMLNAGKLLIPYRFEGYWKDVGTIESYYEAQMEMISYEIGTMMFQEGTHIFSNSNLYPAHYIGKKGKVKTSMISNGCVVEGSVTHSSLASAVEIGAGSKVKDSVLLPNVTIGKNCKITKAIVNEGVTVKDGSVIEDPDGKIIVVSAESEWAR
ncbi:MAG: glucose-1-phosphate adenylyltransferase [Parasporobacterium sp.]|nr:glucose-1-phosphate adenylyltransferase [Parasporobacterium sp.]